MVKKNLDENENRKINQGYVPSDYKHVQAVLDKKAEEMLEKLYGRDWKEIINGKLPEPNKNTSL